MVFIIYKCFYTSILKWNKAVNTVYTENNSNADLSITKS